MPNSVKSARLLVSRSEKGGLLDRAKVMGGASGCSLLCAICQPGSMSPSLICPSLLGSWLTDLCSQCDRAWDVTSPEWNYFSASSTWCTEPISIPGSADFIGCGKPPFAITCDDPIVTDAPAKLCAPQERICAANSTIRRCSDDGLRQETIEQCRCDCDNGNCSVAACTPNTTQCLSSTVKSTCSVSGCDHTDTTCACGCANNDCRGPVCSNSYCRDSHTLIECKSGGCATQTVTCGYGCSNDQCLPPPGPLPDMSSISLDLTSPLPLDLAGPATPEVCDGVDNNKDGVIDELPSCWLTVYRFRDPTTNARCYGPTNIAPSVCSGYTLETTLFSVPSTAWRDGSTTERVQCSKGTDHIITSKGGGEHSSLLAAGWSCTVSLGYWFANGAGPRPPLRIPFTNVCPVYRLTYATTGGNAHLFSSQNETIFGAPLCEPPTRGEAAQSTVCGKPSGC